jgi:membrane associated rhomboid family serine protease
MSESAPLVAILRLCAAAAPVPWYPKQSVANLGLTEEDLFAFVEQLRRGGLIARTDAVAGYGRGYVLTPLGVRALENPGDLEWLRRGEIPPPKGAPPEGTPPDDAVPERERAVRMSLLAPFTAHVNRVLILANVAVFLWGVYLGHKQGIKPEAFLYVSPHDIAHKTGAINADDLMKPGWGFVRLLTCCFVHFGLVHLAANMISLYLIGPLLERMWGHIRFLVLYLFAGFAGSCAAMVLRPTSGGNVVMLAGASGAIWGLLSALAVWVLLNRRYMPRRLFSTWGMQIVIAFVINIALTYQMSNYLSSEAHYGGGIAGAVCAVLLHLTRFGPAPVRALAALVIGTLPAFGLWAALHPARFSTEWERLEMEKQVMPEVKKKEDEAIRLVPDAGADPLIGRSATRRDRAKVEEAISHYRHAEEELRSAADRLRRVGPYREPQVEKARTTRLELVEARLDLLERNQRCLEAGADWKGNDEKQREEAITRLHDREREWRKLLQ